MIIILAKTKIIILNIYIYMSKDKYYEKYKIELDLITKYIANDYIYNVIFNYKSIIDGKVVKLSSNINVHEMVFLCNLIKIKKSRNVLEIGCANGVSGMVIIDQIIKNGGGSLISIDPYQSTQWDATSSIKLDIS